MIQQLTKGIQITIDNKFEGDFFKNKKLRYLFSYIVKIENNSNDAVQLISRYWEVFDALKSKQVIEGEGVLGVRPLLKPGGIYQYDSNCTLVSPIGIMKGYYNMISLSTTKKFKVYIPSFKLCAPFILN